MSLPYNQNIPQATTTPAGDQPSLLANNQISYNSFGKNHVSWSQSSKVGFHTFINMVTQSSTPTAATDDGTLFSALDANNVLQLFWQQSANLGSGITQITGAAGSGGTSSTGNYTQTISAGGTSLAATQYYTVLPGQLYLKLLSVVITTSATSNPIILIPFLNSSGGNNFFPTQPLIGFAGNVGLGLASNAISCPCSASAGPSSPTLPYLCYTNGVSFTVGNAGTTYFLIIGV